MIEKRRVGFQGGGKDAGAGGGFGGNKGNKGNKKGGDGKGKQQKSGPPAQDRFKTSQQLKQQIKDVKKAASGTASFQVESSRGTSQGNPESASLLGKCRSDFIHITLKFMNPAPLSPCRR